MKRTVVRGGRSVRQTATLPSTPSDRRGRKNTEALLRRLDATAALQLDAEEQAAAAQRQGKGKETKQARRRDVLREALD